MLAMLPPGHDADLAAALPWEGPPGSNEVLWLVDEEGHTPNFADGIAAPRTRAAMLTHRGREVS